MKTYQPATADVRRLMMEVLREFHPDNARLSISITMVESDQDIPPIEARIFGPLARCGGSSDCGIFIDSFAWDDATDAQRRAWVDHALASFHPVIRANALVTDQARRPRVKKRKPQMLCAGYPDVLRRHGVDSLEHQQANALAVIVAAQGPAPFGDRVRRNRVRVAPVPTVNPYVPSSAGG